MSQKSSLPQAAKSVSQVLMSDSSGSPDDWARRRLAEALLEMSRMQAERSDMREV